MKSEKKKATEELFALALKVLKQYKNGNYDENDLKIPIKLRKLYYAVPSYNLKFNSFREPVSRVIEELWYFICSASCENFETREVLQVQATTVIGLINRFQICFMTF